MIKIEFSAEEVDALELERYHHPDPKVQKKMEALYLKSQQRSRIRKFVGCVESPDLPWSPT